MLLPQLLAICCPNWKSKTHKERTAEPFQDEVGQPFRISYFTEKSVTKLVMWAEDGCPNVAEEHWFFLGAYPGSLWFLSFLTFFGCWLLALPAYLGNIISFSCLWWNWRLYSYSLHFQQIQKETHKRGVMCIKLKDIKR